MPTATPIGAILAVLPSEHGFVRRIVRGARDELAVSRRFALRRLRPTELHRLPHAIEHEHVRGILAFAATDEVDHYYQALALPVVNVSARLQRCRLPQVIVDNRAVGQLAATHLLERGYKRHAFVGIDSGFSRDRQAGWQRTLNRAGARPVVIDHQNGTSTLAALRRIEPPFGVVTCHDALGRDLMERCIEAGFNVPTDIAFVGVDDAEEICEGGALALSSVATSGEAVGRRAIEALTAMIDGAAPPPEPILVPPGEVVVRESSDTIAGAPHELLLAVEFIRQHALSGIGVEEIVTSSGVSRAKLYRLFSTFLQRTPLDEIRRIQMQHATRLLTQTNYTIADIAHRCGFGEPNYFMRVFRQAMNVTPTQYRRQR